MDDLITKDGVSLGCLFNFVEDTNHPITYSTTPQILKYDSEETWESDHLATGTQNSVYSYLQTNLVPLLFLT